MFEQSCDTIQSRKYQNDLIAIFMEFCPAVKKN